MTKTQEDFFIKIFTSHFIARVQKGCVGFYCERELEIEHKLQYFDPKLMAGNFVSFSFFWCSSIFSGPQFIRAPSPFGLVLLSLPHLPLQLPATQLARQTQLSYIIVWRPLNLWNRMFNRHQAEITIMQFTGHSLPVHQSMRVSWDFLACPILLANFNPCDFLS